MDACFPLFYLLTYIMQSELARKFPAFYFFRKSYNPINHSNESHMSITAGARLWNSLPADIIACDTLPQFRRKLKNIFV